MPGTTNDNNTEIPKKKTMRGSVIFKKVDITLSHKYFLKSFLDVVTTYSICFETWSIEFSCEFFRYFY